MPLPAGPGSAGVPQQYQGNGTWVPDPAYQGGGWWSYPDRGTHYTEPQLEALWMKAGGSRQLAPLMAAIAEQRESGGWSAAWNSTGATGLWQIEWPGSAPKGWSRERLFDPEQNARAAVLLSGNSLSGVNSNWAGDVGAVTVPGFNPSSSLPPGPGNAPGGPGSTPATLTSSQLPSTCLIGLTANVQPLGFGPKFSGGNICILSKSQARAVAGAALLVFPILILTLRVGVNVTVKEIAAAEGKAGAGETATGATPGAGES